MSSPCNGLVAKPMNQPAVQRLVDSRCCRYKPDFKNICGEGRSGASSSDNMMAGGTMGVLEIPFLN
jgi:hypothetical protein